MRLKEDINAAFIYYSPLLILLFFIACLITWTIMIQAHRLFILEADMNVCVSFSLEPINVHPAPLFFP